MRSIHIGQNPFAQAKWAKMPNPHDRIDAYHYPNRTGTDLFYLLRPIAMNLPRLSGYRSIRHGQRELAHDI